MANHDKQIALGVVLHNEKVLVIERQQRETGKDGVPIVWAFPGGKLQAGETAEQAAAREVLEETGYAVQADVLITSENHLQFPVYVHYIGCRLIGSVANAALPATIVAVDWAPVNTLDQLFAFPINDQVKAYLDKH